MRPSNTTYMSCRSVSLFTAGLKSYTADAGMQMIPCEHLANSLQSSWLAIWSAAYHTVYSIQVGFNLSSLSHLSLFTPHLSSPSLHPLSLHSPLFKPTGSSLLSHCHFPFSLSPRLLYLSISFSVLTLLSPSLPLVTDAFPSPIISLLLTLFWLPSPRTIITQTWTKFLSTLTLIIRYCGC